MERRKFVIGVGSLAAGGAAAMGTGAFSAAQMEREANFGVTADDESLISLIPGHEYDEIPDSTLSDEFVSSSENQLQIDLTGEGNEGVNTGSTYQLGAIGDENSDDLDLLSNWNEDDVIYGEEPNQWLDEATVREDPAFVIENETQDDITVQISWSPDDGDDLGENVEAALVMEGVDIDSDAEGDDLGAGFSAAFDLTGVSEQPDSETTGGVPTGGYAGVSIIVKAGDDAALEEYMGDLVIRAEGAVVQDN